MRITKNVIPFLDVLFTFLMVFLCIMALLKAKSDTENAAYQQQNAVYLISLTWEGNADLDLWGKDPVGHAVGFSNREGGNGCLMSLNRDCLGASTSEYGPNGEPVNKTNEEIIAIRGTLQGEYVFNVHSYALKGAKGTKAHVKLIKNKPYKIIVENDKVYESTGDEETFFRFTLDKDGNVIATDTELPAHILPNQTQQPAAPSGPQINNIFEEQ